MKAKLVTDRQASKPFCMKDMKVGSFATLDSDPTCVLYKITESSVVIVCAGVKDGNVAVSDGEVNYWENARQSPLRVTPLKPGDMIEIV